MVVSLLLLFEVKVGLLYLEMLMFLGLLFGILSI